MLWNVKILLTTTHLAIAATYFELSSPGSYDTQRDSCVNENANSQLAILKDQDVYEEAMEWTRANIDGRFVYRPCDGLYIRYLQYEPLCILNFIYLEVFSRKGPLAYDLICMTN